MKNSEQSNFRKTNNSSEFGQEEFSYDTLINLPFWFRDTLLIWDCLMRPFLNLTRNFLLIEIEILIFLLSHSVFHQWDKWILTQLTHPDSTRSQILCEVIGGLSFNISSWQKLVPKIICLLITELFFYWMLILINRGIFLILPVALLTLRRLAVFQWITTPDVTF